MEGDQKFLQEERPSRLIQRGIMPDMNKKSVMAIVGVIISAIAIIIVGFFIYMFYWGKTGSIKIRLSDNQLVEINLEGKKEKNLSIDKILDELLVKDENKRIATVALLKKHDLYEVSGTDTTIVSAIEKLAFDAPVSKAIRDLLNSHKGPFKYPEEKVELSVPSGVHIQEGKGASCKKNEFYRKEITVFNEDRTKYISSVYVNGHFPCPENDKSGLIKLIQLSRADMEKLIGDSPLNHKEIGYVQYAQSSK